MTQPVDTTRLIAFSRRLRLLSAVGIAGVAAGILAEPFVARSGLLVPALMSEGQILRLPIVWVPLATILAVAAWTYLLVGALHAPLPLRLIVAVGWVGLGLPLFQLAPLWAGPGYLAAILLLLWRRWARPLIDFGIWESLVFGLALLAAYLPAAVASLYDPQLPLLQYNVVLSSQFTLFALLAMPLLILAGMDLAEVAGKAGGWATGLLKGWPERRLAWLLLGLSLLQGGYFVTGGVSLTPGFWLTILWVVGLVLIRRWLPREEMLSEPPFPLLIGMLVVALAVPTGGVLFIGLLPAAWQSWVPGVGFAGSTAVAALVAYLMRFWLERRWPGAWVALLVTSIWMAWMVTGGKYQGWGPVGSAVAIAVAGGGIVLALLELRSGEPSRRTLLLGLETLAVLTAIHGMEAANNNDLDPGDIFAAVQAVLVIGSVIWLGLVQRRLHRIVAVALGLACVLAAVAWAVEPGWLSGAQDTIQLGLMAVAMIWGIAMAHRRMGELLGEGKAQIHQTFLLIGFSLMVVAVLGWNRALTPPPAELTDFGPLAAFGLIAVGLPLYLLSVARRL